MKIEVNVDSSKLERALSDIPEAMARAQRNALTKIGDEVKSEAEQTFRHPQMRPSPWAPRKNNADPERPLLQKSGVMKRDIDKKIEGNDTVVIFTPHEYIKYHQFGTKHMPARPVFPIDKQGKLTPRVLRKIKKIVEEALAEELEKTFGH